MLKWLFVATCDLNLVKLNYETADGDTLFQLVCHSEPLLSCISSTEIIKGLIDTTYDLTKLKVTTCKTADGDTLLQLICQTESCVSRISSPVMLNWLIGTTSDLSKHIVVPMYTTADGDTLLQLVCKSESCVSFVSSSVMLKWLTNTTNNITKLIVPNWITANGDTLLDLVFHSESLLSQITSEKLLSWLDSSNAQLTGCILCSWKTANEDTLFKLICTSQCSLTHMSSALMLDWLNNGSERKINILEMMCPNWTTSNGDAVWHLFCQSNVKEDEVIELLLLNKEVLNPNFRSSEGNTAIHLACKADKPAIVMFLMTELHCDINVTNNSELLPIEMTKNPEIILSICQYYDSVAIPTKAVIGWLNSTATIDNQSMMEILKELNHKHKLKACDGSTLLHLCCGSIDNFFRDKLSLVYYLLNVLQCDPNSLDNNGQMPLQVTLDSRIMKKLVQYDAKITSDVVFKMISDEYMTLYTSEHKVIKILLLSTTKKTMLWRPNDLNNDGDTALHLACKVGRPAIVKYLLKNANCNPSATNSRNELPIELTTNIEIISLLIEHGATMAPELFLKFAAIESIPNNQLAQVMWNPDITNNEGNTALHLACQSDLPDTVNLLLSQTHCDPNVKNNNEEVPLQMTTNPDIINDLIRYGARTSIMYKSHKSALGTNGPIKPPVKMFVVGNPSVGKSTLTAALKKKLNIVARWFTSGKVSGVEKKTVGIIPHEIESEVFGRVTVYDFAGHREFYSGHTALLKAAIQSTPPIFLLVVNLLDGESEIIQNVLYWVSFLENQCTFVSCKPHLIIIGSHADTLKSKGVSPQEKVDTLLGLLGRNYFINLEFIGFIPMDCQLHESTGMNNLRPLLVRSCSQLRIQEPITFNAHCFLVHLLETFKGKPAVTISTICKQIEKQLLSQREGVLDFLPKSTGTVYKICVELNERGHILFLKDKKNVENSYVVIEEKSLLSEVSGTVFASKHFKEYKQLATNSGVVSLSKIKECFPDKDLGILMGFLTHLEFCHEISDQALLLLISEKYATKLDSYYLFPELISLKAKESVWKANCDFKYDFGWILQCTEPEQFFSSRFIQVLLLRLAFSFALESSSGHPDKFSFHQKCSLWKNGIFWGKHFGMEMLVETIKSKSVIVMARFKTSHLVKCLEQRSQVLHTVLECIQEFCPRISTVESFIDTSSNSPLEYPFEVNFTERTLCTVKDLAEALAVNYDNPSVVLSESGNCLSAKSFFTFEPYAEIEASTLQELWDENNENIAVSVAFLSRLVKNVSTNLELLTNIFSKSDSAHFKPYNKENVIKKILNWMKSSKTELMTYSQLHKELDRHSVFAGRYVLSLAGSKFCSSIKDDAESTLAKSSLIPQLAVQGKSPTLQELLLLKVDNGNEIRIMEAVAPFWKSIATTLGFDQTRIESIDMSCHYQPEDSCREMFRVWLEGVCYLKPATWSTLIQSLKDINLTEIEILLSNLKVDENESKSLNQSSNSVSSKRFQIASATEFKSFLGEVAAESDECSTIPTAVVQGNIPEITELLLLEFSDGKQLRIRDTVAYIWKNVAITLGFNGANIKGIEMSCYYQTDDATLEMFKQWLKGAHSDLKPATWSTLIQSLKDVKLTEMGAMLSNLQIKDDEVRIDQTLTESNSVQSKTPQHFDANLNAKSECSQRHGNLEGCPTNRRGIKEYKQENVSQTQNLMEKGSIPPLDMKALEIIEGRGGRKIKVIEDIGSHWENLAVELGIQQEIIDQIKNEIPSHNHHEACNTVLATWLEGNSGDVSWDTLAQCLITAGLPELADNLKESLRLD